MAYTWTLDKFGILHPSPSPTATHSISVDEQDPAQHIKVLGPSKATHYLGLYVSQTGATKPMEQHLWNKASVYTRAFQRTHMSRQEAGVLYHSCFLPTMMYSFPAFWFPPTFLDRIH